MGALARLIAHHPDTVTLAVELGVVLVLVLLFGGIWLRERRRRGDRSSRVAEMRDEWGAGSPPGSSRADETGVQEHGGGRCEDGAASLAEPGDRAAGGSHGDAADDQAVSHRPPP